MSEKDGKQGHSVENKGRVEHQQSWSINKKHRAVARMELSDAWEMRRSVMIIVVIVLGITCTVLAYGVKKAWEWVKY
jgi:hypothetical protein